MKNRAKVKLDKKTGNYFIKLKIFEDYLAEDISKVDSYKLEITEDLDNGYCLLVSFYDKDGKLIETKESP